MANLEVLALDTAVPQIRAPGAGDGYSVPRDMTMASGTTLAAQAVTSTSLGTTGNLTLNGGTANGVLYLNGSKVATSGSALTFDGTTLNNTGAAPSIRSTITGGTYYTSLNTDGVYANGTDLYLLAPASKFISFYANNAEQMRLTSTGLGIGTASPSQKLHVASGRIAVTNGFNIGSTDGNTGMFVGTNTVNFQTNGNTVAQFDASGNLGIGATSPAARVDIRGSGAQTLYFVSTTGSNQTNVIASLFNNGSAYSNLALDGNTLLFRSGASATEAARIDASGNLLVGATSQVITSKATILSSNDGGVATCLNLYNNGSSAGSAAELRLSTAQSGSYAGTFIRGVAVSVNNSALTFGTEGSDVLAERARITAGGYFKASNDGTYLESAGSYHEFRGGLANGYTAIVSSPVASPASQYVFDIRFSAATPNDTNARFLNCADATATRAYIRSNGGLSNYQSNNTDLSDARTKNSITPAASMWDKIGALEIVTYKYNDQTHDDVNVGVIAQQVEAVEPVWVDSDGWDKETPEGEEPLKTVYTKDITFAAIKALQEAMARIEQLEAKVAALEAR